MLRGRNWMSKFESCNRIRKRLLTIWVYYETIIYYLCFIDASKITENCLQNSKYDLTLSMPQISAIISSIHILKSTVYNSTKKRNFQPFCLPAKISSENAIASQRTRSDVFENKTPDHFQTFLELCSVFHSLLSVLCFINFKTLYVTVELVVGVAL